ncbi:MAG: Tm-1-like ATP-binding domain-containing protein [Ilumatobacteraceae bacterium]
MTAAHVVGTLDTNRDKLLYVRDVIAAIGLGTVLADVGTTDDPSYVYECEASP